MTKKKIGALVFRPAEPAANGAGSWYHAGAVDGGSATYGGGAGAAAYGGGRPDVADGDGARASYGSGSGASYG